jgi:hypothetical protein
MEKGQWVFTTNVEKYALGQWISENRARKDFNCCQGGRIAKISVSCLPSKDVELSGPGKLYLQLSDNPDSDAELDEVETARAIEASKRDAGIDLDKSHRLDEEHVKQASKTALLDTVQTPAPAPAPASALPRKFGEGDEVEADYCGKGSYMTAVVVKVESGARERVYDLVYEDGRSENRVPAEYVRGVGEGGGRGGGDGGQSDVPAPAPALPRKFGEGDEVEADYRGKGSYMTAVVLKECRRCWSMAVMAGTARRRRQALQQQRAQIDADCTLAHLLAGVDNSVHDPESVHEAETARAIEASKLDELHGLDEEHVKQASKASLLDTPIEEAEEDMLVDALIGHREGKRRQGSSEKARAARAEIQQQKPDSPSIDQNWIIGKQVTILFDIDVNSRVGRSVAGQLAWAHSSGEIIDYLELADKTKHIQVRYSDNAERWLDLRKTPMYLNGDFVPAGQLPSHSQLSAQLDSSTRIVESATLNLARSASMDQWCTETSHRAALHASKLAVAAAQAALAKSDEAICAADQLCAELLDWAQTDDAPLRVRGSRQGSASLRVPMCPEWLDQTPDRAADQLHGELLDWATPVRTSSTSRPAVHPRVTGHWPADYRLHTRSGPSAGGFGGSEEPDPNAQSPYI